jgi:hypothetical protein
MEDIVTRLRGKEHGDNDKRCESCDGFCCQCELCDCCLEILEVCLQGADEIQRLRDERDKWQLMAADLGEHLENALYSDEWKTREYAIVAFGMFERALPHWRKGRILESEF